MARKQDGLRFGGFEQLKDWLLTTKWGADVLREVLASKDGSRFYAEFVQRELATMPDDELPTRPTYVVVELAHDGFVKVYGERHVRAKVVQRPGASGSTVRMANLVDEWVELELPRAYRSVYYPTAVRATGTYERLTVRELTEREHAKAFDLAVLKTLDSVGARS